MIRFVACQSFAGGFDLGATQAGMKMVHKVEQVGGFGLKNVHLNRHLTGQDWTMQAVPPAEWEPVSAEAVLGNPPCSGFSPLSVKTFRGPNSPINSCMWAFAEYVSRVRPYVAVFESVQQAFSGGRELMQMLRTDVEQRTGWQWNLFHVKHNAAGCGGCAIRRRYFWVIARVPFGVEQTHLTAVPKLWDVIGDLSHLGSTWEAQPYGRGQPSWWINWQQMRSDTGLVDGHVWRSNPATNRAMDLLRTDEEMTWGTREIISSVARRYYEKHGRLPESWNGSAQKVIASNFNMGYNQMVRWNPNSMARVATGAALDLVMHPYENRTITHREVARIMGFPDDWRIRPMKGKVSGLHMTWGKGIAVQAGRWIGYWVRRSIEGEPGSETGQLIGEREWLIDHTNTYKRFTAES